MNHKLIIGIVTLCFGALIAVGMLAINGSGGQAQSTVKKRVLETQKSDKVMWQLADKKQGVYYFGFEECLWCQELSPVLEKTLQQERKLACYINTRNQFSKQSMQQLKKYFSEYRPNEQFSVPFIIFINEGGDVKTHTGTVDGHNAQLTRMNGHQKHDLHDKLAKLIVWTFKD
ncbi:MAG: hypothetical protein LBT80_05480 [Lactobacillaceae bacterium]|jgi:predicted bacteriocin transport accessory protein|nr:hypothetical protein [Lactobacillaceae bacterium]